MSLSSVNARISLHASCAAGSSYSCRLVMTWRIDPGGSQTEGEIAEQLTGRGVVGKKGTIKKDDAFHRSARKPGRAPRTRGAQVKPLSRIRVGPAPGRFHP